MDVFDLLIVGIEVSIAIAGFAGLVATFQFRNADTVRRGDAVGLTMIVTYSLSMAFCCVLPLVLVVFGIQGAILWSICSIFGATLQLYFSYKTYVNMKGAAKRASSKILFAMFQVLGSLNALAQISNIFGFFFQQEPGPYIAGIVFGLFMACYMFVRMLLRPVWRTIHAQEALALARGS